MKTFYKFLAAIAIAIVCISAGQLSTPAKNLVYTFTKKVVLQDSLVVRGVTYDTYDTVVRTVPVVNDTIQMYYGTTLVEPAGTLSDVVLKFPTTPVNNQKVYLHSTKALTNITYNTTAIATGDNTATLAAQGTLCWVYFTSQSKWYRRQ